MTVIEPEAAAEDRDGPADGTPELLLAQVAALVARRQELRAARAGRTALEQNRGQITRAQWDFSRALIARHHRARVG